jgi:hypothetical protein
MPAAALAKLKEVCYQIPIGRWIINRPEAYAF